jgi:SpoVK/Ycf46/Vps4 family AAA+-type ATPase
LEASVNVAEYVIVNEILPKPRYQETWDSIVGSDEVKDRLLHTTLLGLQLRPRLSFDVTALHGLVLLYGPPGTGKTTLARGVAQELSGLVQARKARLIEVNPHGLMSAEHGQSQQKVFELLCEHVPLLADDKLPTVVVLDEVESMSVARSAASLSANPADVHRATDAVLAALDRNASSHPHLVTVATSNFTEALDEAFKSRADVSIEVPLPNAAAIEAILTRTLTDFSGAYPKLKNLVKDVALSRIAKRMVGVDGRRVRKVVTEAMAMRRETVLNPELLSMADLKQAVERLIRKPVKGTSNAAA